MSNTRRPRLGPAAGLAGQARDLFAGEPPEVGEAAGLAVALLGAAATGDQAALVRLAEAEKRHEVLGSAAVLLAQQAVRFLRGPAGG